MQTGGLVAFAALLGKWGFVEHGDGGSVQVVSLGNAGFNLDTTPVPIPHSKAEVAVAARLRGNSHSQ